MVPWTNVSGGQLDMEFKVVGLKLTQFFYCVFLLFRCSFHSYADSTYAKHLESGGGTQSIYGTLGGPTPIPSVTPTPGRGGGADMAEATMATMTMRAETPRE